MIFKKVEYFGELAAIPEKFFMYEPGGYDLSETPDVRNLEPLCL